MSTDLCFNKIRFCLNGSEKKLKISKKLPELSIQIYARTKMILVQSFDENAFLKRKGVVP